MVACIILLMFNGVNAFLTEPFDVRTFIASYISVCSSLDPGTNPTGHNSNADWLMELADPGFCLAYCLLQNPETRIQFLTVGTGEIQRSSELCANLE